MGAEMASTMVSVRMDEDVKRDMEAVCKELGLSMSAAFNIFAKKVGREHRIPFEVSCDPFYSTANVAHIRRGIDALDAGHGAVHDLADDE